jgi:hypothetical protein
VATAIAAATHGQLVAQLPGGTRIDAAATYADVLAQIDGLTPTMADAARRFKSALVGATQDLASNRIVFTMASKSLAEDWVGEQIAIRNRLVVCNAHERRTNLQVMARSTPRRTRSPSASWEEHSHSSTFGTSFTVFSGWRL